MRSYMYITYHSSQTMVVVCDGTHCQMNVMQSIRYHLLEL